MNDTEFPAKYTVFWLGQTVHVCERHYESIEILSRAMGMKMPDCREEEGHECANCINEAGNTSTDGDRQ